MDQLTLSNVLSCFLILAMAAGLAAWLELAMMEPGQSFAGLKNVLNLRRFMTIGTTTLLPDGKQITRIALIPGKMLDRIRRIDKCLFK